MTDHDIIDLKEVLDRVGDNRDLLLELMEDFSVDFQKRRKEIDQYVAQKDFDLIKSAIHFIKGGAGNISLKATFECCMLIEYLAIKGDVDLIKEVLEDIDSQFQQFQEFIVRFRDELK